MKRLILLSLVGLMGLSPAYSQIYTKLNGLYALAGVINPAVEFRVSPHSTVQGELVVSPWKSIHVQGKSRPFLFGILMGEYRYYLKEANNGIYFAANAGMMQYKMSKPEMRNGKLKFENRYSKGSGYMVGLALGWERRLGERWLMDTFLGWSYMNSKYNGYSFDGVIDMYPHRTKQPLNPDPYNASGEWYPNKIGVSFGYLIFDPAKNKKGR